MMVNSHTLSKYVNRVSIVKQVESNGVLEREDFYRELDLTPKTIDRHLEELVTSGVLEEIDKEFKLKDIKALESQIVDLTMSE